MLNPGYVMNPDQEPIVERDKGNGMIRPTRGRRRQVITDVMAPNSRMEDVEPQSFDTNEEAQAIDDAAINEENQNTLADPPVDFRQAMSGLSNYIRESGFQPYQRSGESAAINEERKETAVQNYEQAQAIERRKQRQAVLSQGIMAIADLFTLNQKGGSGVTGAKPGVRISEEASNRLEAERITFERELEGYYNRLFQEAELEERVDQRNVEMANQIQRENLAGQLEVLTNTLQQYESGELGPDGGLPISKYADMVRTLMVNGQYEQAMQMGRETGIFDENFNIDFNRQLRRAAGENAGAQQQQEQAERDPNPTRTRVDLRDYNRLSGQIAELEREMAGLGAIERENDPRNQQLESLQERQQAIIEKNPAVEERIYEREAAEMDMQESFERLQTMSPEQIYTEQGMVELERYARAMMTKNNLTEEQAINAALEQFVFQPQRQQAQQRAERDVESFLEENSDPTEGEVGDFLETYFQENEIEDPVMKERILNMILNRVELRNAR